MSVASVLDPAMMIFTLKQRFILHVKHLSSQNGNSKGYMVNRYPCGHCSRADPLGGFVWLPQSPFHFADPRRTWHSLRIGFQVIHSVCLHFSPTIICPNPALSFNIPIDVIKSRIQLRTTPPTSRPWTYINEELRAIVSEGGV